MKLSTPTLCRLHMPDHQGTMLPENVWGCEDATGIDSWMLCVDKLAHYFPQTAWAHRIIVRINSERRGVPFVFDGTQVLHRIDRVVSTHALYPQFCIWLEQHGVVPGTYFVSIKVID